MSLLLINEKQYIAKLAIFLILSREKYIPVNKWVISIKN